MSGCTLSTDELLTVVVVSLFQVLFVSGTLFIAMSLQLDRRGVWNMMAPCLFALVIMVTAWVSEGSQAGPAALCSPWGMVVVEQTPAHPQAWLETLKHPDGEERARDSPSSPAIAEKSPGSESQTWSSSAVPKHGLWLGPGQGLYHLCWALVPQFLGGFCTAEMGPNSKRV